MTRGPAGEAARPGGGAPSRVDLAIFAHQEEASIAPLLAGLARQSVWDGSRDIAVLVLANGCTDATVARAAAARAALPPRIRGAIRVLDLPQPGKSRTVERFIHDLSRPEAETLLFMDADIRLPDRDTLARMLAALDDRPELRVFTSRPVKDVVHDRLAAGPVARLIAMGGDGLDDYRTAICGQLFAMRASAARDIHLPAGLPVEDGFVRAMMLTDLLSGPERFERIDADPGVFHVYESIRSPGELIRHQTRIVVGSAVNAALFGVIRRETSDREAARRLLSEAARDDGWLARTLARELPRAPYGYVPFAFLTKRWHRAREKRAFGPRALAMLAVGLGLDAVVWLRASLRMARGTAAGHW